MANGSMVSFFVVSKWNKNVANGVLGQIIPVNGGANI